METPATDKAPLVADPGQHSGAAGASETVSSAEVPDVLDAPSTLSTPSTLSIDIPPKAKSIASSVSSGDSVFPRMLGKCKVKLKEGCERIEKAVKGKVRPGNPILLRRDRNSDIDFFGEYPQRRRSCMG